jgi:hypothetical protein
MAVILLTHTIEAGEHPPKKFCPTETSIYTLPVTDANGCTASIAISKCYRCQLWKQSKKPKSGTMPQWEINLC